MTKEAISTEHALKLALDALDEFCELGAIIRPLEVRDALRVALASRGEALSNEALDRMAENARELGLDYGVEQDLRVFARIDAMRAKGLLKLTAALEQPAPDGVGGCAMCGAAYEDQVIRQSAQQVLEHAPCLGMNCGITRTDQVHSAECQAEHAAAIAGGKFVKPAQQEPVGCEGAVVNGCIYADRLEHDYKFECEAGPLHLCADWVEFRRCFEWLAQHTSPPTLSLAQRQSHSDVKPLTNEEIWDEVKAADLDWQTGWSLDEDAPNRYITFARAIEAAHGIKGNE